MITSLDLQARAELLSASEEGRRVRESAGVSRGEVAAAVGTSDVVLARWEDGEVVPVGAAAVDWVRVVRGMRRREAPDAPRV